MADSWGNSAGGNDSESARLCLASRKQRGGRQGRIDDPLKSIKEAKQQYMTGWGNSGAATGGGYGNVRSPRCLVSRNANSAHASDLLSCSLVDTVEPGPADASTAVKVCSLTRTP